MQVAQPPVALYVHFPFCVARCPYCDFTVLAGADARGPRALTEQFSRALLTELELRANALEARFGPPLPDSPHPGLRSVYFGGGTPSLAAPAFVAELMTLIRRRFGLDPGAEVTLEANPGPDERGELAAFRRAGINRVSFGAQSFDPAELRRLGRRHSPADVAAAVAEAREAGIASVNLDLLYDVPGQTSASWTRSLDAALALSPDHLSLYALTLDDPDAEGLTRDGGDHLPTAPGARRWRERARLEQDDDRAAEEYTLATERLAGQGWRGYEISNWARPGHESSHNLAYWRREPYEAVGPGAHAFDGATRRWNAAAIGPYLAALAPAAGPPSLPPGDREQLSESAASSEQLILAMRLDGGVPATILTDSPHGSDFEWAMGQALVEEREIEAEPRLVLTLRGRLLSNELFSRLV